MGKRGERAAAVCGLALLLGCGEDRGAPGVVQPVPNVIHAPAAGAPPAGSSSGPLRVGGDVIAPFELVRVEPDCRQLSGADRPIVVELVVTEKGAVRAARVLTAVPEEARAVIVAMARQWLFRPATRDGEPVEVHFNVTLKRCA